MIPLKYIIVDDSAIFREGLRFFIENVLCGKVIAEASNGAEFHKLDNIHMADFILMDIHMPVLDGFKTVMHDKEHHTRKFIAITNLEDDVYLRQLIECGFKGFLNKNSIYTELKKAIEIVAEGGLYFPSTLKIEKY